jgi:prolyl 4-hydroxylase
MIPHVHSTDPLVVTYENFLEHAHCDALIAAAREKLGPSTLLGATKVDTMARSSRTYLAEYEPEALLVERRLTELLSGSGSAIYYSPTAFREAPYITCYSVGQEFKPHFDWIDPKDPHQGELLRLGGQRSVTCIVYLNNVDEGGFTAFPKLGITVEPKKGNAVVFANIRADKSPDERTLHAGTPVLRGEKWILTKWVRSPLD